MNGQISVQNEINLHKSRKRTKMMQVQTMGNPTHKTHYVLDLGGAHHFLPITYFVIGDGGYNEIEKNPKTPKSEVWNFY